MLYISIYLSSFFHKMRCVSYLLRIEGYFEPKNTSEVCQSLEFVHSLDVRMDKYDDFRNLKKNFS